MEEVTFQTSSFDLLFSQPVELKFVDPELDFTIDPNHFIEWLKSEGEEITGEYNTDVGNMCEYSCLYLAMLLSKKELRGTPVIYYGKFGFWEHYWLGYTIDGIEYFIDLTLQQFDKSAPKLAITEAVNNRVAGQYSSLSEGESIDEYLTRVKAFEYYTDPNTMIKPDKMKLYMLRIDKGLKSTLDGVAL